MGPLVCKRGRVRTHQSKDRLAVCVRCTRTRAWARAQRAVTAPLTTKAELRSIIEERLATFFSSEV
jgi:hypothetical protein